METKFNFNSQVCTSRSQSERLLALGLKKETADMCSVIDHVSNGDKWEEVDTIFSCTPDDWNFIESVTPRWSMHRLIEMMPISIRKDGFHNSLVYDFHRDWCVYMLYANGEQLPYNKILEGFQNCNLYDNIIDCIEWLIKEGYFNKEYLV